MFAHSGKTHHVVPCTDQINCSVALVAAETKGSVSLIVAATSGWLPSHFSPDLRPLHIPKSGKEHCLLFQVPQVAPKGAKAGGLGGCDGAEFCHGSTEGGLGLHTAQGDLLSQ